MIDLALEDLKQLLLDGRRAAQYAWDHYDELATRKDAYTLYGPYTAYGPGVAIPWGYIPKRARSLTLKTRRKKYNLYELDSDYKLLRVRLMLNSLNEYTYHCFEMDGIQYSCPFINNKRKIGLDEVFALGYKDGKPYYSGYLREHSVIAHFFEYVSPERVRITEYTYNPTSKYTMHGYLTDPDASIGALNAAANRLCFEKEPVYTDFSQWFSTGDGSVVPSE